MPDGGLITPVLKDADATDIYTISRNWADLVSAWEGCAGYGHVGGVGWKALRACANLASPDESSTRTFSQFIHHATHLPSSHLASIPFSSPSPAGQARPRQAAVP